jgi:type 1 glutamine amidotransferase
MQGLPPTFERFDEWYNFGTLPGHEVTIVATLDESSYTGGNMGEPHPIAWAHAYDGGRSFYTAFGHTAESYSEPLVLTQLANAILWAAQSG